MYFEKSKREKDLELSDILVTIRDTPIDHETPSPYELMFHRKVKTDLPSIPISLWDTSSSERAGYRSVKHADDQNKTRTTPKQLTEEQPVMYLRNPSEKKVKWSPGHIKSKDGERSYTVKDTKSGVEFKRNRTHIKPIPDTTPTVPAAVPQVPAHPVIRSDDVPAIIQPAEELPEVPPTPAQKDTRPSTPRKKTQKTPTKTQATRPPAVIPAVTERPKRTIKAPVRYGDWVPK